ncbi:tRNA (guanine(10)-N(2))-dimethyltransferase [Methanolobus halotolerans]|uniref:tRNA (guanine(26)-N(2))-dimethyltransferase n=1 Tax=Methanolobus halotolerans TaxID=2052935 RepID=A0A4E0QZC8_9EURY|nr:tRNA (guanine(10)-N(2))-dimethyltransferase [Methanolobus halotolerans]TGC09124.1 tRNA (guanine(10)-N(2))-dimethyltransferase [Methanolobus halotolerans]
MNIRAVKEGKTDVLVPVHEEGVSFPPSAAPVFYNPAMELNRDISVAATSVFAEKLSERRNIAIEDIRYLDALSASGIRGLRIANEVGVHTTLNDWSENAFELIVRNIRHLGLQERVDATHKNANVLMHEKRFNIVDIDPFGTPAPFLAAAARCAVHLLAVTATDTAPLCGAHLHSGIRKYSAVPFNNEYHAEMGVRILLGKVARELAITDKFMVPLLSHATRHYVRTYLEIGNGAKKADEMLEHIGFILHCTPCGFRQILPGMAVNIASGCPRCSSEALIAGPLWLGKLHDIGFCGDVLKELERTEPGTKEQAKRIIGLCMDELEMPTFYEQHLICKRLGVSASGINDLINTLKSRGFAASRTHFSGTSFKTDAGIDEIENIIMMLR